MCDNKSSHNTIVSTLSMSPTENAVSHDYW